MVIKSSFHPVEHPIFLVRISFLIISRLSPFYPLFLLLSKFLSYQSSSFNLRLQFFLFLTIFQEPEVLKLYYPPEKALVKITSLVSLSNLMLFTFSLPFTLYLPSFMTSKKILLISHGYYYLLINNRFSHFTKETLSVISFVVLI